MGGLPERWILARRRNLVTNNRCAQTWLVPLHYIPLPYPPTMNEYITFKNVKSCAHILYFSNSQLRISQAINRVMESMERLKCVTWWYRKYVINSGPWVIWLKLFKRGPTHPAFFWGRDDEILGPHCTLATGCDTSEEDMVDPNIENNKIKVLIGIWKISICL